MWPRDESCPYEQQKTQNCAADSANSSGFLVIRSKYCFTEPLQFRAAGLFALCKGKSDQSSSDQSHLVDFLGIAAAGQVVDGRVQTLQDGAVSLKAAQTLCNLVADIASIDVGEDEGIGVTGNLRAGGLQLADFGGNGGIKLQLAVDLQLRMSLLDAGSGVAHLVNGLTLAGTLGGVGQQSNAGINAKDLSGVSGLDGGLNNLVLRRINVDGAVAHGDALIAAHQDEAGTDGLDAGLALDQLQSRTDGVSGGVSGAAQQAVGLAHLDQHGAKVIALGQSGTALLVGHFALAQLNHFGNHCVKLRVSGGIKDLGTGDIKIAVGSSLFDGLGLAQQDDLQGLASQQTAGGGQDTSIGALSKDDGLRLGLQFLLKIFKNGHTNYLHVFAQSTPAQHLHNNYSTQNPLCKGNVRLLPEMGKIRAALANMTKYFTKLIIYQATLTKKYQIRPPTATTLPPAGRPKSAAYPPRSTSAGSCDGTDACPKRLPHCHPARPMQTGYAPGYATGGVWRGAYLLPSKPAPQG